MNNQGKGSMREAIEMISQDPKNTEGVLDRLEALAQKEDKPRLLYVDIEALWVVVKVKRPDLIDRTTAAMASLANNLDPIFRILKLMENHNSEVASQAVLRVAPTIPGLLDGDYLLEAGVTQYMLGSPWLLEGMVESGMANQICERSGSAAMKVATEEFLNGGFPLDIERGVDLVAYLLDNGFPAEMDVPGWDENMQVRAYRSPLDKACDLLERGNHARAGRTIEILVGGGVPLGHWESDTGDVGQLLQRSPAWRRRRLGGQAADTSSARPKSKI